MRQSIVVLVKRTDTKFINELDCMHSVITTEPMAQGECIECSKCKNDCKGHEFQ